jgi:hypothetical protein
MTCPDARELLSDLVDGALTPDEQGRIEAHLAGCADCRKEHERLRATVALLQRMDRPRAPVGFVDRVLSAAQPVPWYRRWLGRLFLPVSVKLPAEAAAVLLVAGLAVFVFQRTPELQTAARQAPAPHTEREQAPPVATAPAAPVVVAPRQPATGPPPPRVTPSPPPSATTPPLPSSGVLVGGPARSRDEGTSDQDKAKIQAAEEQQNVVRDERAAAPGAKGAPASPEPPAPVRQLNDELKAEALKKEADLARKSVGAAAPRPPEPAAAPPVPAPALERRADSPREKTTQSLPAAPPPPHAALRMLPPADVTGRLAVKDLDAAQQALNELLARSGGVVAARREDAGTILMDVAVPKPAYADFKAGLMRIGTWLPEGEPSESAASVRITLRLVQ